MPKTLNSKRLEAEGGTYENVIVDVHEREMAVFTEGYRRRSHMEVVFADGLRYPVNQTFALALGAARGPDAMDWVGARVRITGVWRNMPTKGGGQRRTLCKDIVEVLDGDDQY